jgi:hypothetical protein
MIVVLNNDEGPIETPLCNERAITYNDIVRCA